jgi:hypothetical protein
VVAGAPKETPAAAAVAVAAEKPTIITIITRLPALHHFLSRAAVAGNSNKFNSKIPMFRALTLTPDAAVKSFFYCF